MTKEHRKRIIITICIFILLFLTMQQLLIPKRATEAVHGNMIREYYKSLKDHDIVFIGDCEVFGSFSPVVLWNEFGFTSFVRGSPQQLVWQSYYILEETLRYERPELIVFSVLAMQYNEPQNEAYNRLTLDGMRWSMSKVRAINASKTSEEEFITYVFPFFRFRERWRDIGVEDFRYFFNRPQVSSNGFMVRSDVRPPAETAPNILRRTDYTFGNKAVYYLEKITALAAAHDIPLVLIKAPTKFPAWHDQWNEQIKLFASSNDLLYINFLDYINEIGLDFNYHTFDGGYTLNVVGAEKLTKFFGEVIAQEFELINRQNEPDTAELWAEKSDLYHRVIARQLQEIYHYGSIQCLLMR